VVSPAISEGGIMRRTLSRWARTAITASLVLPLLGVLTTVGTPGGRTADAAGPTMATLPTENPANWTPNVLDGEVVSIWQIGSRVVIAGEFTQVADADDNGGTIYPRTNIAAFDATTGLVDTGFDPVLDGTADVVIPAGDGTSVFVGGSFGSVNGTPRPRVARVDLATGDVITSFDTNDVNGIVRDMRLVDGRLVIGGAFTVVNGTPRSALASLDPATGAVTDDIDVDISGQHSGGTTRVTKMETTPDGERLLIIGNFTQVGGLDRDQVALLDLSGASASVSPWDTEHYEQTCLSIFETYMRDLDISEDGSYAIITTTGAYRPNSPCDTTARFELTPETGGAQPTWSSYTGGDTLYGVEIHDGVAYIGGHLRWVNNPFAGDRHGAGGVARSGMAALDVVTGLPFAWNPGRTRGVGLFDYHVTDAGLWAVSDTDRWGNYEFRARLAFFPWDGGDEVPVPDIGDLPGQVMQLGRLEGSIGSADPSVLYRVNAGGPALPSADDGPDWEADSPPGPPSWDRNTGNSSSYPLAVPQNDATVPDGDGDRPPADLWSTERWDPGSDPEMAWSFPVDAGTPVEVRIYLANRYSGTDGRGERVFDIDLDGVEIVDELDLSGDVGHDVGTMRAFDITSDGSVDIVFRHVIENPLVNGIEIVRTDVAAGGTSGTQDEVTIHDFDGTTASNTTVEPGEIPWHLVRGAFQVGGSLFTFHADGQVMSRPVDETDLGPGRAIPVWSNTMMGEMPNLTGIFYDPATASIHYTLNGSNELHTRSFLPDSGVIAAGGSSAIPTGWDPSAVRGMFIGGGKLFYGDAATGDLMAVTYADGVATGSATLIDDSNDWRSRALLRVADAQPNQPPDAAIEVSCDDLDCTFDGSGSTDADGTIVDYQWDFGDGTTADGETPSHVFGAEGTYEVTLTVTDDDGDTDTTTRDVEVTVTPPDNIAPTAVISASCDGLTCSFDGTGSTDADGTIVDYQWDFGDGTTATGATPTRVYDTVGTFEVTLTVTDDNGVIDTTRRNVRATTPVTPPPVTPPPGVTDVLTSVTPARVLETRPGEITVDGRAQGIGIAAAGSTIKLQIAGRAGVPDDADAAMLNIAAVFPAANGYLTVYPCNEQRPLAANVNYQPGGVYPNAVLAKLDPNGNTCIYTKSTTHIVADINGYVPDGASPVTVVPRRVLETRPGETTADGQAQGAGIVAAGQTVTLKIAGRAGVPDDADAAMLNIAAVFPAANGYLTVYPCNEQRPLAANVNYQPGGVYPNAVLAKLDPNGNTCIYTKSTTHIVADINGYVPDA
jgi:chitodextrinase